MAGVSFLLDRCFEGLVLVFASVYHSLQICPFPLKGFCEGDRHHPGDLFPQLSSPSHCKKGETWRCIPNHGTISLIQKLKPPDHKCLPSTHVHRMVVKRLFGASLTHPSVAMSTTKTKTCRHRMSYACCIGNSNGDDRLVCENFKIFRRGRQWVEKVVALVIGPEPTTVAFPHLDPTGYEESQFEGGVLTVCGEGPCCTEAMQKQLSYQSKRQFDAGLRSELDTLANVLLSRAIKFDVIFKEMMTKAKTDFHTMFKKTYGIIYE
ncbi:unnamed protein product, partial [Nesidiocoris tenuis]